jgi:hypothetical protein
VASEVPQTYPKAMLSANAECWTKAIDAKLQAMNDLKVWDIAVTPEDKSLLSIIWVFKKRRIPMAL